MKAFSNTTQSPQTKSADIFSKIGVLKSSKPKKDMEMTSLPTEYYSSSPYIFNYNMYSKENNIEEVKQSNTSSKSSSKSSFDDNDMPSTTIIIHDPNEANDKPPKKHQGSNGNGTTDIDKDCLLQKKKTTPAQFLDEDFDEIVQSIKNSKNNQSSSSDNINDKHSQNFTSTSFLKGLPSSLLETKNSIYNETRHDYQMNKIEEETGEELEILKSPEQALLPIDKPKPHNKTFLSKKSISPKDMIHQHDDEVQQMTNTIEISNFYEYTKSCMKMIVNISDMKYTSPAKVSFPFAEEKDDNDIPIKKRLAVFDLDETLVHCLVKDYSSCENIIEVLLPSKNKAKIGVNIRPHWQKALRRIQKAYHIVVYTASHQSYADSVLNFLDPENKFFPFRLYRNNCIMINNDGQILYVKDCSIFKDYDLKDVVLVDNSVLSFAYHLDNGIPIVPYYDAEKDFELLFCACYLESIVSSEDVRIANRKQLKLYDFITEAIEELEEEKNKKKKRKSKVMTPQHQSKLKEAKNKEKEKEKDKTPTNKSKGKGKTPTNKIEKSKTKKSTFSGMVTVFHKDIQVNGVKNAEGDSDDN